MDSIIQFISRHPAVKWLLIANVVLFPIGLVLGDWCGLGLVPGAFLGKISGANLLSALGDLVRYQFFHASVSHLLFNMAFFLVFGISLAHVLGTKRFLFLYYGSGVISGLTFCLASALLTTAMPPQIVRYICFTAEAGSYHMAFPMIGASGAVAGVMGAALALVRDQPIFSFGSERPQLTIASWHVLLVWIVWQVYLLISTLGAHSFQAGEPILHVSGFAFGFVVACHWSKRLRGGA